MFSASSPALFRRRAWRSWRSSRTWRPCSMASLSANEKAFVALMAKSHEHARRGFDLLEKRENPERFFDELAAAGLFDPSMAPAPEAVDADSVRLPVWSALGYLLACA